MVHTWIFFGVVEHAFIAWILTYLILVSVYFVLFVRPFPVTRLLELCTDRCASHAIEAILFRVPQIVAEEMASGTAEISDAASALNSGHHGDALPAGMFVDRSGNGDDGDDDQSPPPPPMTVLFAQFCEVCS